MSKHRKGKGTQKSSAQSSAALVRNGWQAFQSADYGRAIDAWDRVAAQAPDRVPSAALAEAHFRRGLKHRQESDLQAYRADMERAAALRPEDPCYTHHLGLAALLVGDLDRAIEAFSLTRRVKSEFAARAAYPLALALLQRGDNPAEHAVWSALSNQEQAMLRHARTFRYDLHNLPPEAPPLWRALAALNAANPQDARPALVQASESESSPLHRGIAHYYLGVLAVRAEDWEDVARHWNAAWAAGYRASWLKENVGEVYHRLAEDRLQSQDLEGALIAAAEAARHKPQDHRIVELVSQAYQRVAYQAATDGRWDQALEAWQSAQETGEGSFRLAYNLALAYEHAEEWTQAGDMWREALRRRPRKADHPDAIADDQVARLWRRAAQTYDRAGDYQEATNVYRQALKWNPDSIETRMALAESLLNDGRTEAARNELERILERAPDHIPALMRMGEAVAVSDYWWGQSGAPTYWRRVLELDPNHADARQSLVDFYLDQAERMGNWHHYPLALNSLQQALEIQPDSARVLASMGACYVGMDQEETARSFFDRALTQDPQQLDIYRIIIHALLDNGHADQAGETMARAEAAVEHIPFTFYISQAALGLEYDQEELVRSWLERAVAVAPPDEPVLAIIGEMAMVAQVPDLAREYLERALQAGQASGQAHLVLGILAMITEHDFDEADKHWRRAEKLARQEGDSGLMGRINMARTLLSAPPDLFSLLTAQDFDPGDFDPDLDFLDEESDLDDF